MRGPYFGHHEKCFSVDNKCYCTSSAPFRLPPEPPITSLNISADRIIAAYRHKPPGMRGGLGMQARHPGHSPHPAASRGGYGSWDSMGQRQSIPGQHYVPGSVAVQDGRDAYPEHSAGAMISQDSVPWAIPADHIIATHRHKPRQPKTPPAQTSSAPSSGITGGLGMQARPPGHSPHPAAPPGGYGSRDSMGQRQSIPWQHYVPGAMAVQGGRGAYPGHSAGAMMSQDRVPGANPADRIIAAHSHKPQQPKTPAQTPSAPSSSMTGSLDMQARPQGHLPHPAAHPGDYGSRDSMGQRQSIPWQQYVLWALEGQCGSGAYTGHNAGAMMSQDRVPGATPTDRIIAAHSHKPPQPKTPPAQTPSAPSSGITGGLGGQTRPPGH